MFANPSRERRVVRSESGNQRLPSFSPDRLGVPGVDRELSREPEAVDRGHDPSDLGGVEVRVAVAKSHPFEHTDMRISHACQDGSVDGADDRGRRDPGGAGRLLERGMLADLFVRDGLERLLHRERAARRREPPDQAHFSACHRSAEDGAGISDIEHHASIGTVEGSDLPEGLRGYRRPATAATGWLDSPARWLWEAG